MASKIEIFDSLPHTSRQVEAVPSSTSNAKELITKLSVGKSVPSMCPCLGSWVVEVLPRFGTRHIHISLLYFSLCLYCQIWNRGAQAPRTISLVSFESHCCHFSALFGAQWTRADCGLNAVDVAVAEVYGEFTSH